jgi:hypothetical protein
MPNARAKRHYEGELTDALSAASLQLKSRDRDLFESFEEDSSEVETEELLSHARRGTDAGPHRASFFSRLLFLWVQPLLRTGTERQLTIDDLFEVPPLLQTVPLAATFQEALEAEFSKAASSEAPKKRLPPVFFALRRQFGSAFYRAGVLKALSDLLQFLPPIILADYLESLSGRHNHVLARWGMASESSAALCYALLLFALPVAKTCVEQAYFYRCQCINLGVKSAITTAVYSKATRLSASAKTGSTSGEVLNLMQTDASRLGDLMTYLHVLWSALLQTVGYLAILYSYMGWSTFGGLLMMLLLVPVQGKVFSIIGKRRKRQMKLSDKRVKVENETLSGIRVVKLNGWEAAMRRIIDSVRNEELAIARSLSYLNALVSSLITTLPTIVAVAAFSLYSAVMHRKMDASVTFPALALFSALRFPLMFLPRVLSMVADAHVSLQRLQKYLGAEETEATAPLAADAPAEAVAAALSALPDAGAVTASRVRLSGPAAWGYAYSLTFVGATSAADGGLLHAAPALGVSASGAAPYLRRATGRGCPRERQARSSWRCCPPGW